MKAFVSRVGAAELSAAGATVTIGRGCVLALAVADTDTDKDVRALVDAVAGARIFPDGTGADKTLLDIRGEVLILPDENVLAKCIRGRRPIYDEVADAAFARDMYEKVLGAFRAAGLRAEGTPDFGGRMDARVRYEGYCTFIVDTYEA